MRSSSDGGDEHVLSMTLSAIAASIRNGRLPYAWNVDYTGIETENRPIRADVL
jgi:hypothetical protein